MLLSAGPPRRRRRWAEVMRRLALLLLLLLLLVVGGVGGTGLWRLGEGSRRRESQSSIDSSLLLSRQEDLHSDQYSAHVLPGRAKRHTDPSRWNGPA
jgi:hypothetical protein